jgi:hypothetical protein
MSRVQNHMFIPWDMSLCARDPVKVWSKRRLVFSECGRYWERAAHPPLGLYRKINAPYKGTLSSYGYVLLVIYFLVHVKNPPVLPNLQQMPPLRPIAKVRVLAYFSWPHGDTNTFILGGHTPGWI